MSTNLLAFDIGINNLAYAHISHNPNDNTICIKNWSIIQLKQAKEKKEFSEISKILMRTLQDLFWDNNYDVILLENQPVMKNPVMKTIQIMIYSFFMVQKTQKNLDNLIKLVSAQNKLKVSQKDKVDCSHITTENKYKRNKETAIAYAKYYLNFTNQSQEWIDYFDKCPKLDDISETLLYIVNHLGL